MQVFKNGKRHFYGGVLLSYRPNNLTNSRVGFAIGKKYSLSAVARNRQKRILRSVTEQIYTSILPGFDIVISYTNRDKVLPYKEALEIISKLLSKADLIKK